MNLFQARAADARGEFSVLGKLPDALTAGFLNPLRSEIEGRALYPVPSRRRAPRISQSAG